MEPTQSEITDMMEFVRIDPTEYPDLRIVVLGDKSIAFSDSLIIGFGEVWGGPVTHSCEVFGFKNSWKTMPTEDDHKEHDKNLCKLIWPGFWEFSNSEYSSPKTILHKDWLVENVSSHWNITHSDPDEFKLHYSKWMLNFLSAGAWDDDDE